MDKDKLIEFIEKNELELMADFITDNHLESKFSKYCEELYQNNLVSQADIIRKDQ